MSNEITAYFKGRIGVAESVYQYDYGMVLVIDGIDFTNNFDCYFSTAGDDEAIPAIGADNRVAIPNDCLTRAGDVTLHIPSHAGENDSEVEYVVTFKVIGRARPVDDGTAEEQSAVSQAIALLNHTNSSVIETIDAYLDENADSSIQDWLDDHPEATTTVQDGAITEAKLNNSLKVKVINDYVTPEMFGAAGDGETDDTDAFQAALHSGKNVKCMRGKTYLTHGNMRVSANTVIDLNEATLVCTDYRIFLNYESTDTFLVYNGNGNITIKNGDIVGGCISFAHGKDILFENLRFNSGILNHFVEICACKNFHIRHCYFGALYNEDYTNEHVNIDPCTQSAAPTLNIESCDGTINDSIYITDNVFERLDGYMYDAVGVHYVPDTTKIHTNINICNNIIRDAEKWGISIWGCSNSLVKGNDITCNEYGIRCGLGDSNVIENNVFFSTKKWNLISFSSNTYDTNITVIGNKFNHVSKVIFASVPSDLTIKRISGGYVRLLGWSDHKTEGEVITLPFSIDNFDKLVFYCGTNSAGATGNPAGASFIEIPVANLRVGHYTMLTWSYASQLQCISIQADTSDYTKLTVAKVHVTAGGGIRQIDAG